MGVFLSPGVYTREIDISVTATGTGALRPAFIGTAKKGPLNVPTLITTAAQYIETFGDPFPESYLGYAVVAYLEEGSSCYVLRVGVEYQDGMSASLAAIAIDTSGSDVEGWGRIPVFTGIDYGRIYFREVSTDNPLVIHAASVPDATFIDANDDASEPLTASALVDSGGVTYSGCLDETFSITITGAPTGTGPIDGATFAVTDSSGDEVTTGTLTVGSDPNVSDPVTITATGIIFTVYISSSSGSTGGSLDVGDTAVLVAVPDNRSMTVEVEGVPETLALVAGTYTTAATVVAMINGLAPTDFGAVELTNSDGVDVPALITDVAGERIQVTGTCAACAEFGIDQYEYNIPRSYLLGTEVGPYNISSANNRVVIDDIGQVTTIRFDFSLPSLTGTNAAVIAAAIDANGSYNGTQYFNSLVLRVPAGLGAYTEHVLIVTTSAKEFDQLKMQATFSFIACLRFAQEIGIDYPYTSAYTTFIDSRVELPVSSSTTPGLPYSCEVNPASAQCALDTAYYENIVGFFVAKYPGTWVDDYTISLAAFTEGVGETAGRFKITVNDTNGVAQDVVEDVSFLSTDTRYIGNVVNEGSSIGGVNGNLFYQWEERPSYVGTDDRVPSQFINKDFAGGENGIPSDPADSVELDKMVIGNPSLSTGLFSLQNSDVFDFNLLCIPGFASGPVIAQAVQFCENRGDVLYLVDPPYGLRPQQVVDWHNGMLTSDLTATINTSYGALYWSWLKINDLFEGGTIWVPPCGHVAAVFARTERIGEQWFAPAGLNRGQLLSALDIEYNPTQGERDLLYGSGNAVNPIVNFVQQGIVVWGQRTLQRQSTALDRVNVRMLLVYLKKNLSRVLRSFVFEQNDEATRSRIRNTINPFLSDVAARRGLTAYVVICDETNNTPERIDRNELWVSVFIKPTRVAEFIVLNLVVLRTGANFGAQEVLAAGGIVTG